MNYWLAVGSPKNWDTAFNYGNIWGLKESQRRLWENVDEGDILLFYATSPVRGIIGYGVIQTRFKQNKPLWPDERKQYKVIWPLRLEFNVRFSIPQSEWITNGVASKHIWPRGGFQLLRQEVGAELVTIIGTDEESSLFDSTPKVSEIQAEYSTDSEQEAPARLSHDETKRTLVEIGKLQKYIAEQEYPFDIGKLDVVWRRVEASVPTYVFEVQIGGDVYHALAKLKHAFDLWNSHIFIIAPEDQRSKVDLLLSGTFHEIEKRINFIDVVQVKELLERKRAYFDLERELGI